MGLKVMGKRYIKGSSEFLVTMSKVAFAVHLAIAMLLKVPASLGFILIVYIRVR